MPPSSSRSSLCSTSDSSRTVADRPIASPNPPAAVHVGGQIRHRDRRGGEPLALQRLAEHLPQLADLVIVDGVAEFDDALVNAAAVGDHHQQQPGRGQRHDLEMPDRGGGQRRVLHNGDLTGQLRQQPHRAAQHVVEVDAGFQEFEYRGPLGCRQRLDVFEPVDELPVALLRRYPARAGVRLGDVALRLEDGHVVAHGRAGHAQVVPFDERLRADRLLGRHEVRDDGSQHLEPTIVGTTHLFTSQSASILRLSAGATLPRSFRVADRPVRTSLCSW